MFRLNKYYLFLILLCSSIKGQDVYSAYGLGEISLAHNASVIGAGSIGLMPDFQRKISLNNPTTWMNMPFAYISINYGGVQIQDKLKSYENI